MDLEARFDQKPDQFDGFVAGDAAADAENHDLLFAAVIHWHKNSRSAGSAQTWRCPLEPGMS
jgi:hypothetical protein